MRPAMAIAATSIEQARALIDRGLESDGSQPAGTAYLLSTSDSLRNVRSASYPLFERLFKSRIRVSTLRQDALTNANDVLFYFTGKAHVEGLDTLHFVPGAIADHLTSADSGQMSALRWLEASATGSYGTVSEPCNLTQKFPNPGVVSGFYLRTIQGPLRLEGKGFWSNGSHPVFSRHGTCCLPAPAATRAAAAHDRRGSRKTASNCSRTRKIPRRRRRRLCGA